MLAVMLSALGAWAQNLWTLKSPVTTITTGKYVLVGMCSHGTGPCYYNSAEGGSRLYRLDKSKSEVTTGSLIESSYVWDVELLSDGKITVKWADDNSKFFIKDSSKNQNFQGTDMAQLIPEVHTIDGKDYIALTLEDTNIGYIHANAPAGNPNLSYWPAYGDDGTAVKFTFYPVEQQGDLLVYGEQMQDGKIYRIQSSTRKTFTGIDGYTCNMKNQEGDANNPGQLWKYVIDGNKAYLQNVYAGLYPQYVKGGGDKTTSIGTSKDYPFTYSINDTNVEHIWNIFFGGRQVNIESDGNVNYWNAENAHHFIYEVEATDEELATMCMNWYNANKYVAPEATASSYQKIDIDENATEIISPNEFAAPSVINEAIDNLAEVEGTLGIEIASANDIHTLFEALSLYTPAVNALTAYNNAVTAHGELLSIAYTPKAEWGTIILPINWANPEGWGRYTCAEAEGSLLTLADFAASDTKNTPMIVSVPKEKIGTTYQMIGYSKGAGEANVTAGLLTGVLEDNTEVPAGSYVLALQKTTGKIGFFPVAEDAHYVLDKYKCYLTLPVSATRYNALFFEGEETGIESIETENAKAEIYDLAGRRVQKAQKGLYIVNGVKVIK